MLDRSTFVVLMLNTVEHVDDVDDDDDDVDGGGGGDDGDDGLWLCADVDVAEPDEKSLITYVSSLYDVFPDVPSMEQSLRDSVRSIHLYSLLACVYCRMLHSAH